MFDAGDLQMWLLILWLTFLHPGGLGDLLLCRHAAFVLLYLIVSWFLKINNWKNVPEVWKLLSCDWLCVRLTSTTVQHCQCHIKSPQFFLLRTVPLSKTISVISDYPNLCYSSVHHCLALIVSYQISQIYITPHFITVHHSQCHIKSPQFMLLLTSSLSSTLSVISNLPNLCYSSLHHCPALEVSYQITPIYVIPQSTTDQHCQCHINSPQFTSLRRLPLYTTVSVISNLPNFC
jgi:hypothetical protein